MKALDSTDQKMLALLQDNSRTPLVSIAKAIGLSRSAAQERLTRLEKTGIIEKYTLRIKSGSDAEPAIHAWFSVKLLRGFSCDDVMPSLIKFQEIKLCQSVAGEIDLLVFLQTHTLDQLAQLRETVLALKGVDTVSTQTVLRTQLDRR
jgi:Lrp/AsnC family transcriptional regulator, leucine-responsive regulatory protein